MTIKTLKCITIIITDYRIVFQLYFEVEYIKAFQLKPTRLQINKKEWASL